MREIILDTETTGLKANDGDRIIEIGCLELINHIPTGNYYHTYINPERDVPPASTAITGLTAEFLKPYPLFKEIVDDFLNFIKDDKLVIHNARFDIGFLNAELGRLSKKSIPLERSIDTLLMARKKFPGAPATLDALCKRFNIDLSRRDKHGALLDSELLAAVYLELLGGRQRSLLLQSENIPSNNINMPQAKSYPIRFFPLSEEEKKLHKDFLEQLKEPLWSKYLKLS